MTPLINPKTFKSIVTSDSYLTTGTDLIFTTKLTIRLSSNIYLFYVFTFE